MLFDIISAYRNTITINCFNWTHFTINLVQGGCYPVVLRYSNIPSLSSDLFGSVGKLFVFLFKSLCDIVEILAVDNHVSAWRRGWQHWFIPIVTLFSLMVFYHTMESVGIFNYLLEGCWDILLQRLCFQSELWQCKKILRKIVFQLIPLPVNVYLLSRFLRLQCYIDGLNITWSLYAWPISWFLNFINLAVCHIFSTSISHC